MQISSGGRRHWREWSSRMGSGHRIVVLHEFSEWLHFTRTFRMCLLMFCLFHEWGAFVCGYGIMYDKKKKKFLYLEYHGKNNSMPKLNQDFPRARTMKRELDVPNVFRPFWTVDRVFPLCSWQPTIVVKRCPATWQFVLMCDLMRCVDLYDSNLSITTWVDIELISGTTDFFWAKGRCWLEVTCCLCYLAWNWLVVNIWLFRVTCSLIHFFGGFALAMTWSLIDDGKVLLERSDFHSISGSDNQLLDFGLNLSGEMITKLFSFETIDSRFGKKRF